MRTETYPVDATTDAVIKGRHFVGLYHMFNGPLPTRLTWVVEEISTPTKGWQGRFTPEEAAERGLTEAAACAAIDNAVYLGGDL